VTEDPIILDFHDKYIKNEYECKICKYANTQLGILSRHWRQTHQSIDSKWFCWI
jgi:hypothetical protein